MKDMAYLWAAIRHHAKATGRIRAVLAAEEAGGIDANVMSADLRRAVEEGQSATDALHGAIVRVMRWGDHDATSIESVERLRDAVWAMWRKILESAGPAA